MLKEDEISGNYSLSVVEHENMFDNKMQNYNESFISNTSEIWNISTDEDDGSNDISILSNHDL